MLLCVLLSFIYCVVSNEVQSSSGRFLAYGQVGGNGDCYIVSAQYQTRPTGGSGDVFAAAMGKSIAGLGYPWTAVGYVRGSYDLDYYNNSLDQVTSDANGAVVAWAFVALAEFCDVNGKPGYQVGSTDFVIKRFDAPLVSYSQTCGHSADPVTGLDSFYSSVQSGTFLGLGTPGAFNTTCRVFPSDTSSQRNGRFVTKYQFKCDVRVDYTNLWETNPITINGCSDSNRYIGLLVNVVASAFDVDVAVDSNFNTRVGSHVADSDGVSLGGGKLKFGWDNYYYNVADHNSFSSSNVGQVTYGYVTSGNASATYKAATDVKTVIFSFGTPKSANQSLFYWDPTITVNASPVLAPLLGMVLAILSVLALF